MKRYVVAVFDAAVRAYNQPFFVPSIGMALRSFGDEVNRKVEDNPLAKHPEDYHLAALGMYDEESGRFSELPEGETPRILVRAVEVLNKEH